MKNKTASFALQLFACAILALDLAEAIEAYTRGSAYAEFQEKEKGSITPGKLADMVLLSDDIFSICEAQSKPAADLIITNAKIWTVDKSLPLAQSVAVLGDRIVAVGSSADVNAWRGANTKLIDAGGKLLIPGFNDAHVHFVSGGLQLDNIQLNNATSSEEFAHRIAERAKITPKGEWILGGNWDETKWNPPDMPTKEMIDAVTPDTPVFVSRYDGHMGLANSVALRLAGITAKTADPPGGTVVRDAQGNPTGALKDAATDYMDKVIPPLSHDQRVKVVKRALEHAASLGVTSVQHMVASYEDIAVYSELLQRGELTTRIYAAPLITHVDDQAKLGIGHAFGGPDGATIVRSSVNKPIFQHRMADFLGSWPIAVPHCGG